MTGQAIAKVKAKRKAWRNYLKTKSMNDYKIYAKLRNQARWETRRANSEFEKKIATEAKQNPKAFWNYTRKKTTIRQPVQDLVVEGDVEGNKITSAKGKADALNSFFCSVFTKEDLSCIPCLDCYGGDYPLDNVEITVDGVLGKLKNLNVNKSQGPDQIHPRVLFEARNEIVAALVIIFQRTLSHHTLPSDWKSAHVTPLFKKGSRSLPANYRPVSLTSVVCKICESLLKDSIMKYMMSNNLLSANQYGFVSGRSCVSQLVDVFDDWTKAWDAGNGVDVIYTDFMKAFDKVPHERLLVKLKSYGIVGDVLEWIRQFLMNRRQRVCVEGNFSDWADIASGIPQGSVLGPILFLVYINDLPSCVTDCRVKIFADDTKLYKEIQSESDCSVLQSNIENIYEWSRKWQLRFHPDKCHVLRIGCSHPEFCYGMLDSEGKHRSLEVVTSEKDLGVIVDSDLVFREHVSQIVKKANCTLGIIRRSFRFLDRATIMLLYKALVRPVLEYGLPAWSPFYTREIEAIESVQRRATKLVPGLSELPYEERLRNLNFVFTYS